MNTEERLDPDRTSSAGRGEAFGFTATTVAGIAALGLLWHVSPEEPGNYPTCPFLAISGYWCPGCGSLRAIHALTHGDVMTALERNPLAVVLLPLMAAAWVMWGLRLLRVTTWSTTRIRSSWLWTLLGVVLVYWVARNVPGWTWLSPL